MKAILDSTGLGENVNALTVKSPTPLIPLVNKPIVQYVIEYLVERGVDEIHFVRCHLPEMLENELGTGQRWGAKFVFHLTSSPESVFQSIRTICANWDETPIIIGRADELVQFNPKELISKVTSTSNNIIPVFKQIIDPDAENEEKKKEWSGWAALSPASVKDNMIEIIGGKFIDNDEDHSIQSPVSISTRSYKDILLSSRVILNSAFTELILQGVKSADGILLERNVIIHPTAKIIPPVAIGENSRIGKNASLGPWTVVGKNCLLEKNSTLERSVIFPGSFVGEDLEIHSSIVDKNLLINVEANVTAFISDQFLLGKVFSLNLSSLISSFFSRICALIFIIILSPLYLFGWLTLKLFGKGENVLTRKKCVLTPVDFEPSTWKTFDYLNFNTGNNENEKTGFAEKIILSLHLKKLPGIYNVLKGHMDFVGVKPRTADELKDTNDDWKHALISMRCGLVTLAEKQFGDSPSDDELYASELYYAATKCWNIITYS